VDHKVCHITTVHSQKDVRIFYKECCSLTKSGYNVTLLVANGKSELCNEVQIIGVFIPFNSRLERIRKTSKALYKEASAINASIYHFHDPEFLPLALKLKRQGKKVIYDVHEDVPRQILAKFWIPKLLRKLTSIVFEKYENYVASRLTGIIAATPFIRDRFFKVNRRTIDINNYPIIREYNSNLHTRGKERSVCYVGGLDENRGISTIINAVNKTDVRLNLAGVYDPEFYKLDLEKLNGWKNVTEYGFVSPTEVREILSRSIAGLVTLKPLVNYLDSLPVKMFEYMEAGIPIIASNFPYWRSILEEYNCGICVDPQNEEEIRSVILEMVNNPEKSEKMGRNGRVAIEQRYNWRIEEAKLLSFYDKIVNA
jgi:glycosyltransferase involved in cell wall biosynthesis